MAIQTGLVLLLLVCAHSSMAADSGDEDEASRQVNEAINNQMQVDVMDGKKGASEAFADLAPFLGESQHSGSKKKTIDPWEAKAISDIRGMSQDKLAVSTVSDNELKFAQDAEEAKDMVDQTKQMADMKIQSDKQQASDEIAEQLKQAQTRLGEAADMNEHLSEGDDTVLFQEDEDELELDPTTVGPADGGTFYGGESWAEYNADHIDMLETSEDGDDNFEPTLYDGSDDDIESQINADITSQVGDQLGALSPAESKSQSALTKLAKDAEQAQAAVQDMKATVDMPTISVSDIAEGAKSAAVQEASKEAANDASLGEAQEESEEAKDKLSTSDAISTELEAAQKKLLEAKAHLHN